MKSLPDKEIWDLIRRYISGNDALREHPKVEKWIEEDSSNKKMMDELKNIWALSSAEDFEVNAENAWSRFYKNNIAGNEVSKRKKIPEGSFQGQKAHFDESIHKKMYWYRAAAILLLVTFVGYFTWQYAQKEDNSQSYAIQKLVTNKGETSQITFSDGTTVTLNAASSLRFPKRFEGTRREVYLNGEAYFDVTHIKDKPFIVHTSNANVRVLGTKFNVEAWGNDRQATVGVREGMVSVDLADSLKKKGMHTHTLLEQGQAAHITNDQISSVNHVNINTLTLWMNGGLYFNNTPFSTVVHKISRKFDVPIELKNADLDDVPFTGTFKNAELDEVLRIISTSMEISYRKKNSAIVFK